MSLESHCSDPKRIKLDSNEVNEPGASTIYNNNNFDDLLNSPSDTGENTSIISAFDHDSSSILSGSVYESSCEVLLSDSSSTKGILKSSDFGCRNAKLRTGNRIKFHEIEIYYFNRQQSFCSVPSLGGSALGMEMQHFLLEKLRFEKDVDVYGFKRKYDSNQCDKIIKCSKEEYTILQPIVAKHRRVLLKNSGITRIETVDKEVCDLIRSSRERCGCQCVGGQCVPDTCSCAQNGIQCQVDRGNFPCCCGPNPCVNPLGRVEFNPIRVRTHFIHTIMRLQMQDQYQSYEPKHIARCGEYICAEGEDAETRASKEFDINMCNSTDQGSCRDCQNDKYLQVLMNEWTHQLQKLHTSKHYASNVSIPYNSWTYFPDTFYSTAHCDKDSSMFPILPYSQYTVANLPALNFGINQITYPSHSTALPYQLNSSSYSNLSVDSSFATKTSIANFGLEQESHKTINYTKQPFHHITTVKINSDPDSPKINNQLPSSTYPLFQAEKPPFYSRYSNEKGSTFFCKYNSNVNPVHTDSSRELGYTASSYVHTIAQHSSHKIPTNETDDRQQQRPMSWNDTSHQNKVTHASNGQLYTVLQPVSQSGIVSSFYQNSQASAESCKICKYKSPDTNRQRLDHFCISDFTMVTAATNNSNNNNNHQIIPIECNDKSELCA